jgi:signal transduction histidine kinase
MNGSPPPDSPADQAPPEYDFLAGPGEVRALLRASSWQQQSAMGPPQSWPPSLRISLGMILDSHFPMVVVWGPEFRYLYNDAYRPVLGNKHPAALGRPGAEIFPEAWDRVRALFQDTRRGKAVAQEDVYIPLQKSGYLEDCTFTFSLSPIRDEAGAVTGTLAVVADTTARVEAARRLATLRDLALGAADAQNESAEAACRAAGAVLAKNRTDFPFALMYLHDGASAQANLVETVGLPPGTTATPMTVKLDSGLGDGGWPVGQVGRSGQSEVVADLAARFGGEISAGPCPEPAHSAVLLPLGRPGSDQPCGVLVAGVNPRRALDGSYSAFLDLVADHITTAISNARAFEQERRRAEALAELDRAKTTFFSNVSHELRTPLTLILGPIEDALARADRTLSGEELERVRRNASRLHKMVASLLDLSRMEAGRAEAIFVPTDLAAFTADLAGAFRSVIENAGLRLQVDCPPLADAVHVDPEMWEKIVLNLLSNAVKYTHQGQIRVSLRREQDQAVLAVEDTGVGIPAEELPHLFERFYRVRVTQGRSHEGTGIGLALVQELVKAHGGTVEVASTPGAGSTFTVRVPRGSAHLPGERIERAVRPRPPTPGAAAFLEEASRWSAGAQQSRGDPASLGLADLPEELATSHILLADDNADLRAYLSGLLGGVFSVKATSDGRSALEIARSGWPDLILADVMMPEMDGFALVRALRGDGRTRGTPIILLSARAGEEATVEGLRSGADDYLVKPFSARELIARIKSQLQMARVRAQMWQERARADELSRSVAARDQFLSIASHELRTPLTALELHLESMLKAIGKGRIQPPNEQLTGRLEAALRQIDRLARLIETLLDLSRLSLGRLDLEREELDLAELVNRVVQANAAEAQAVRARFRVETSPAWGHWDRLRLEQVLGSILSTALKYAPGTEIEIRVGAETDQAVLVVRHAGMGIAGEDLTRIFERFERAVAAANYGAMGVGLYLARKIVEAHGGTMQWDSAPDRGETFTVRLPAWTSDLVTTGQSEPPRPELS